MAALTGKKSMYKSSTLSFSDESDAKSAGRMASTLEAARRQDKQAEDIQEEESSSTTSSVSYTKEGKARQGKGWKGENIWTLK